jgi:sphingolipid delta-4 desaturase
MPFAFDAGPSSEPHGARRRAILRAHPEVNGLRGPWAGTAAFVVALVSLAGAGAAWAASAPLGALLVVAYAAGAVLAHALTVLVHECAHDLVFRRRSANRVLALLANVPLLAPTAITFRPYHLRHHARLGEWAWDADLPAAWEERWVGRSAFRKTLWLALFPVMQALRPLRPVRLRAWDAWAAANVAVQSAAIATIALLFGGKALLFLGASTLFGLGLHPLGGRWIQEHVVTVPGQETYSYYGRAGNWVAFNMGHHVEHHDFPDVPWVRLPAIRRAAPEFYDGLRSYRSWTGVLLRFLFDRHLTPWSRGVRRSPGTLSEVA